MSASAAEQFHEQGFVVLRGAFDPGPLRAELERALADAVTGAFAAELEAGAIRGQYVPMMCARTPHSLALFDRLEPLAAELLAGSVLPARAKGVRYFAGTPWHSDSELPLASAGFAGYFEPLSAATGALRVIPGSHRIGARGSELALETEPGDLIAFDEHLSHASVGGSMRLQWRCDYLRAPLGEEEESLTRRYFSGIFPADWDGGYDVDAFPSYGPDWQRSGRRAVEELRRLGVYALADAQESFARSRRAARS